MQYRSPPVHTITILCRHDTTPFERGSQAGHEQAMGAIVIQAISQLQTCGVAQKNCYANLPHYHGPHSDPNPPPHNTNTLIQPVTNQLNIIF
jgi:hypothetical protein